MIRIKTLTRVYMRNLSPGPVCINIKDQEFVKNYLVIPGSGITLEYRRFWRIRFL